MIIISSTKSNADMNIGIPKNITAVQWLVEQIKSDHNQKALSANEWMEVIEQAKQMEKEQIMKAFLDGKVNHSKDWAEEYYNETYGQ